MLEKLLLLQQPDEEAHQNQDTKPCGSSPVPSIGKESVIAVKEKYLKGPDPFSQNKQRRMIWSQEDINKTGISRFRSMPL